MGHLYNLEPNVNFIIKNPDHNVNLHDFAAACRLLTWHKQLSRQEFVIINSP